MIDDLGYREILVTCCENISVLIPVVLTPHPICSATSTFQSIS